LSTASAREVVNTPQKNDIDRGRKNNLLYQLTLHFLASTIAPQAEHFKLLSTSSEKISHSLPHSGHFTLTSLNDLFASKPGQCVSVITHLLCFWLVVVLQ
jgi:hypothetical protein